jgi:hypothetical protein
VCKKYALSTYHQEVIKSSVFCYIIFSNGNFRMVIPSKKNFIKCSKKANMLEIKYINVLFIKQNVPVI